MAGDDNAMKRGNNDRRLTCISLKKFETRKSIKILSYLLLYVDIGSQSMANFITLSDVMTPKETEHQTVL
jgi:hypothetical protein